MQNDKQELSTEADAISRSVFATASIPSGNLDAPKTPCAFHPASGTPQPQGFEHFPAGRVAEVLQKLLAKIRAEFDADSASLWLVDRRRGSVRPVVYPGPPDPRLNTEAPIQPSICELDHGFVCRALARPGEPLLAGEAHHVGNGTGSRACAPLQDVAACGRPPRGCAPKLNNKPKGPSAKAPPAAKWLISAVAASRAPAVIALHHHRPKRYAKIELQRARTLFREFACALEFAHAAEQEAESRIQAERSRLARELHDNLAQGFAAVLIQLDVLETHAKAAQPEILAPIELARNLGRESLADARRAIRALRPRSLDDGSLSVALARWLHEMGAGVDARLELFTRGAVEAVSENIKADLLHIAQEAVTNALQHGQAGRICVKLAVSRSRISLTVEDDGRGGAFPKCGPDSGLGLTAMRERVHNLRGELRISSRPGHGTRIHAEIPRGAPAARG